MTEEENITPVEPKVSDVQSPQQVVSPKPLWQTQDANTKDGMDTLNSKIGKVGNSGTANKKD